MGLRQIVSLAGLFCASLANAWSLFRSDPYKGLTEMKVRVCVETLQSKNPQIKIIGGSAVDGSRFAGIDQKLSEQSQCFEFKANYKDASINVNKVPEIIAFSLSIPNESSTIYEFMIDRFESKNPLVALVTLAQSHYPETIYLKIINRDLKTSEFVEVKGGFNAYKNGWVVNDFAHAWAIRVNHTKPNAENPNGLFDVKVSEKQESYYFNDEKTKALAEKIRTQTLTKTDLTNITSAYFIKENTDGVSLLSWAIRFNNSIALDWIAGKKPEITSYYPRSTKFQGSIYAMATRLPTVQFLKSLFSLYAPTKEELTSSELSFLLATRSDYINVFSDETFARLISVKGVQGLSLINYAGKYGLVKLSNRPKDPDDFFRLLNLLSRTEKYPSSGFENSLADSALYDLVNSKYLLSVYKTEDRYKDRLIQAQHEVEWYSQYLKKLNQSDVPITPIGLSYVLDSQFISGYASSSKKRAFDRPKVSMSSWSELFLEESDFETFKKSAGKDFDLFLKDLSELSYPQYHPKIAEEINSVREDYLKSGFRADFKIGKFSFVTRGKRIYFKSYSARDN